MFKWFVDLFFDVEEEIIEEHPEKPISTQKMKSIKPIVKNVDTTLKSVDRPKSTEVIEIIKEEKKSIFINDVVSKRVDIPALNKIPEINKPEINKKDYTFTPIISPIFGIDDKYQPQKTIQSDIRPLAPNTSALGTVISPIYGSIINDNRPLVIKGQLIEKDIINLSLAEMLSDIDAEKCDKIEDSVWENGNEIIDDPDNRQVAMEETNKKVETQVSVEKYGVNNDNESDLLIEEKRFEIEKQPSLFDYME